MTTAREIIRGTLTFHLNRLSPGEAEDADLFDRCLEALNAVADEINGGRSLLFRKAFTSGTVTGSGTLGTTWAGVSPGAKIIEAAYGATDIPIASISLDQYMAIPDKSTSGEPQFYAHDGLSTVYFYPSPVALSVKILTHQEMADFADLDTDYVLPKGFKSGFQALLAQKLAAVLTGSIPGHVVAEAATAKSRLKAQVMVPSVMNTDHLHAECDLRRFF